MRVTWDPGKRPEDLRDPDDLDIGNLSLLRDSFSEGDNGVLAIEALVYCYESRIQPPRWLTDWLGSRLVSWLDGESESIDKAMRVNSPGKGKAPRLKQLATDRARSDDAWAMFVLIDQFEKSVPKAAAMVQARNEHSGRDTPDATWLQESYRKRWGKAVSPETRECAADIFNDESRRRTYLATFPVDL